MAHKSGWYLVLREKEFPHSLAGMLVPALIIISNPFFYSVGWREELG